MAAQLAARPQQGRRRSGDVFSHSRAQHRASCEAPTCTNRQRRPVRYRHTCEHFPHPHPSARNPKFLWRGGHLLSLAKRNVILACKLVTLTKLPDTATVVLRFLTSCGLSVREGDGIQTCSERVSGGPWHRSHVYAQDVFVIARLHVLVASHQRERMQTCAQACMQVIGAFSVETNRPSYPCSILSPRSTTPFLSSTRSTRQAK